MARPFTLGVAAAVLASCTATRYTWSGSGSYRSSETDMFGRGCDDYGHVYEVSDVSVSAYAIDSNGNYRQPYQEFLDAMNARRCMHSGDYTKDSNVRWVKALASTAREYLSSSPANPSPYSKYVTTEGTTTFLRHPWYGNSPGQIQEMIRNWYDTNEHCTDPTADAAGCTVSAGNDDGDDASPEAYMRMVWLRTRSVGCACVGSQVACIMDAGANIPADEDDPNVVSQLDFNVENICDVGCAACDEINGGECKDEMVGALRADVTLDSCFGATTTSESLAAEAPPPDNADDGLSDIAIALIVVASVVGAMLLCLVVAFRGAIMETIGSKYFKSYVPKLWSQEEKGAVQLAQARQNEMSLKRKTMRETIRKSKKKNGASVIQPSVMLDPMYNPMVNAPVDGDPNTDAHETNPASHFISPNDVLAVHRDLIEKRKSMRLKSIKQKESSMRRRAAAATPHADFKSQGEVSL